MFALKKGYERSRIARTIWLPGSTQTRTGWSSIDIARRAARVLQPYELLFDFRSGGVRMRPDFRVVHRLCVRGRDLVPASDQGAEKHGVMVLAGGDEIREYAASAG